MTLKELRIKNNLSQTEAATIVGSPIRTYRRYESDESYGDVSKRKYFIITLSEYCEITEYKGLLSIEKIKELLTSLFDSEYAGVVDFSYLFGSYAKGTAKENSDVDLYVSTSLTGLEFVGLIERIRGVLHKKVDVLRTSEIVNNADLMNEIMREGVKIYGK